MTLRRLNRYEVIEVRWLIGIENFVTYIQFVQKL